VTPVAVGRARAVERRVQGAQSRLSDVTLRGGKKLAIELGGSILPTPTLTRTTTGSSRVKLTVFDPKLRLLRGSLLGKRFEADLDGLGFRYMGLSKKGLNLSLTLEDRLVARLREFTGPKQVYARRNTPQEVTRAEFACLSLVREALPDVEIVCPELHVQQPIASSADGARAHEAARDRRERGLGATKGLTVKGNEAEPEQIEAGERALRTAASYDAPEAVQVALIAALMEESEMGELSRNWLQIEPESVSGFKGNPNALEEAVVGFLKGYESTSTGALAYYRAHPGAEPYEIAQAVQRSGAGASTNGEGNYGPRVEESRAWVEAFDGAGAGEADEIKKPRLWKVGKNEDYWEAIQRLAKEVNWRAFFVGNRFFFIDEYELARGVVRLAISIDDDPEDPNYISPANVDFDYNVNKPVTEVTIKVPVNQWQPPPGSVVTLEGYGPASIGFGDAPLRRGQQIGLSSNRNAATGEGRARYIVTSISVPLTEDPASREATIKLTKPTAPLPEPASETRSVADSDSGAVGGAGEEKAQELHDWLERQIGKPYIWGAVGPKGYDCSGYVSAGLMEVDLLDERLTTSGFTSWGEAGEGELITVHDKAGTGDPHTEHVVIEVLGDIFECGGISGGVGKPNYSAAELAEFSTKRHPKGY